MDGSSTEYDGVLESLDNLITVQDAFDIYQNAHFINRPPEFFALELAGEAGEVANNEKKIWKGRTVVPSDIGDEAADVFIALINYANSRGISLAEAVSTKLRKIEDIRKERASKGLDY